MATIHTCSNPICNKYFHHVKNMTFHLQEVAGIHYTEGMRHAIASQQLIDKIDPNYIKNRHREKGERKKEEKETIDWNQSIQYNLNGIDVIIYK